MKVLITTLICAYSFISDAQLIIKEYDGVADSLISTTVTNNSFNWLILGANTETLNDDSIVAWEFDPDGEMLASYHYSVQAIKVTGEHVLYTVQNSEGKSMSILFFIDEKIVSVMDEVGYRIMTGDVHY